MSDTLNDKMIINRQVNEWRKEIHRLQDLIATSTGQSSEIRLIDGVKLYTLIRKEVEHQPGADETAERIRNAVWPYIKENPKKCAATISTDPPQDCNWPVCGCDPKANEVLEALMEGGYELVDPSRKDDVVITQTEREYSDKDVETTFEIANAAIKRNGMLKDTLRSLIREAQAVADDHHKPRYTRLDEALGSAKATLTQIEGQ